MDREIVGISADKKERQTERSEAAAEPIDDLDDELIGAFEFVVV